MAKFDNSFQEEMEHHLLKFKVERQYLPSRSKKTWLYHDIADNLYPPIRHGFLQYISDQAMPLHDFINHVRSSQAYAINVLYPVLSQNPAALLGLLGSKVGRNMVAMKSFEFEYSPEDNSLGEWRSNDTRPEEYVTAVDLRIDALDADGTKVIFLVEVKFTESLFSTCGGFDSGRNTGEAREACKKAALLLKDHELCYLHGAKGKSKLHRTYFTRLQPLVAHFSQESFNSECPFIPVHQCLRSHALAEHLRTSGAAAYVVLLRHEQNEYIEQQWEKYLSLLQPTKKGEFISITGGEVIDHSEIETLKAYYRDRYSLARGADVKEKASR